MRAGLNVYIYWVMCGLKWWTVSNSTITVISFSHTVSACATMVTVHESTPNKPYFVNWMNELWRINVRINYVEKLAFQWKFALFMNIFILNTVQCSLRTFNKKHAAFNVSIFSVNSNSKWHANDWFRNSKHIDLILFYARIIYGSIRTQMKI